MSPIKAIKAAYFSPSGGTKRAAVLLCEQFGLPAEYIDCTCPPAKLPAAIPVAKDELLVLALPVYGGFGPRVEGLFGQLRGQGAPSDVGHLEGRALRRFFRQRLHRALHKAQTFVQAPLGAGIQQHLHAEADAQEGRALPCLLQKRLHQPLTVQLRHAVGKSAHAGQHQRPGAQDVPRLGGKAHIRAAVLQCTAHAQKIAAPVIHHCYHRSHRLTSTPRARTSSFSAGTLVLP